VLKKKTERETELKKKFTQIKMERMSRFQGINLYIKNLEDEIDEERLKKEFSSFGDIRSVKIMTDEKENSKGFGFICYTSPDEAQNAITEMNNRILQGCLKPLYVAFHEPKDVRRAKLTQRHAARKIRLNPNAPATAPLPYNQGVFYGNGNVPGFIYGPPQPQQHLQRGPQRGTPANWPQNPYPTYPVPTPGSHTGGRAGGGRSNSVPNRGGRGARRASAQHTSGGEVGAHVMDPNLQHVLSLPQDQQKLYLGEQLYPLISKVEQILAGKITGMLLDSGWSIEELYSLVVDERKLLAKIEEARLVLDRAQQAKDLEEADGGMPDQSNNQPDQ